MDHEQRQPRVRVTGPPRRRTVPAAPATHIDAGSGLGSIYLRSLMREQLRLALRVLAVLVGGVGGLPLLFHLVPGLAEWQVLGVSAPWLLLGVLVYPLLVLLGWRYVVQAERNEAAFSELLEERER